MNNKSLSHTEKTDYTEEENMLYKLLLEGTEEDVHKTAKDIVDNAYNTGYTLGISDTKKKVLEIIDKMAKLQEVSDKGGIAYEVRFVLLRDELKAQLEKI